MAPEVASVERRGGYGLQCDVWAVGITAIELAECQPPLFDMHPMQVNTLFLFELRIILKSALLTIRLLCYLFH